MSRERVANTSCMTLGGPDGKLRFWVKTSDELVYRSEFLKEKQVGDQKKASDLGVDKLKSNIFRNHGSDGEFDSVATAVAKNGHAAFQGYDGFVVDVLGLEVEGDAAMEDASPTGGEDDPTNEAKPAETSKDKTETKVWVDRDKQISAAVRAAKGAVEAFRDKAQKQHDRQSAEFDELIDKFTPEDKPSFEGEIKIYQSLEAMDLVLSNDEVQVKQFIARFAGTLAVDVDASEDAPSKKVEIGNCPPCELYQSLRPFSSLNEVVQKYTTATQPKHLKVPLSLRPVVVMLRRSDWEDSMCKHVFPRGRVSCLQCLALWHQCCIAGSIVIQGWPMALIVLHVTCRTSRPA